MIVIRKCEEHNDQNPDCPVCYPPVGDIPIDAAAHNRIDILGESFRKLTEITEKLLDEIETIKESVKVLEVLRKTTT